MNTPRFFGVLAYLNLGGGLLIVIDGIWNQLVALAQIASAEFVTWDDALGFPLPILFSGLIGACFLIPSFHHLRQPYQKSARTLAITTAVLVCFAVLLFHLSFNTNMGEFMEFVAGQIAMSIAFLSYRFLLKPAALRAFPEAETNSTASTT